MDDLASLLARGERAAFHGPPASAVKDLEQAVQLAQRAGKRAEVTAAVWLLGVSLSAAGKYGSGLRVLVPLLESGESAEVEVATRLFAALAAATTASIHRGLGRHMAAREYDDRGLALTDGTGEAAFDAILGLAADAVGIGDLALARRHLARAEILIAGRADDWWRQCVRFDWGRAEVALLADDPDEAARAAQAGVERAERARAPRHVAKGLLFQGVAELQAGSNEAAGTLRRAAGLAEGVGALPVVWQARALLGALTGGEDGARSLATARSAVLSIAADLPPGMRAEWLARPNVSALLEGLEG